MLKAQRQKSKLSSKKYLYKFIENLNLIFVYIVAPQVLFPTAQTDHSFDVFAERYDFFSEDA